MNKTTYNNIRDRMNPGDVIAFGGDCFISDVFKWVTQSNVSHTGTSLQSKLIIGETHQDYFQLKGKKRGIKRSNSSPLHYLAKTCSRTITIQ